MTPATTAEANARLIKDAYEAFARGDVVQAFAAFAQDILWHVPGRGRCREIIGDTLKWVASFKNSWSYPPARLEFRSTTCFRRGIESSCYAPKAPSAVVEVGHRRKFMSGPSRMVTRRFSGSTKGTNRRKTSSGQGRSDSSAADYPLTLEWP
jgi:hypothetical protein